MIMWKKQLEFYVIFIIILSGYSEAKYVIW